MKSFKEDLDFLRKYIDIIVLESPEGGELAVSADLQGRIMTSTYPGEKNISHGWINYDFFEKGGSISNHFHPYGGEERFWLGPEGGQYSIYFPVGSSQEFENWKVPSEIDTEPFKVLEQTKQAIILEKNMQLSNLSGASFDLLARREIKLLSRNDFKDQMNIEIPSPVSYVGFQSINSIKNTGSSSWTKETGLLSIWILSMLKPSDTATIVIPFLPGKAGSKAVNDIYFGKISDDRLVIKNNTAFFKADGKSRGKIGIPPQHAKPIIGSYDKTNDLLTIATFTIHPQKDYVNAIWGQQDKPYDGDVVNAYNDGPVEDGSQMGPFYEIESSSPAAELNPGKNIIHIHNTFHFHGDPDQLNDFVKDILGVGVKEISNIF
ncbi:MAG: DUF6786 family protein [Bacteroidota bacterium]